jgi:hypothetical protein
MPAGKTAWSSVMAGIGSGALVCGAASAVGGGVSVVVGGASAVAVVGVDEKSVAGRASVIPS